MGICSSTGREDHDDEIGYVGAGSNKQLGFGKIEITVLGLLDFAELPVAMHMNTQVYCPPTVAAYFQQLTIAVFHQGPRA